MSLALETPVLIGKRAIIALGVLALALGTLQAVVEPSLPLLQRDLGIGPAQGSLITIMMLIAGAVIAPIAGKLGDRYGGKRVLVVLMTVVSAGGLISGLSPNLPVLLLGQVFQGAMVGALPLSFILVRRYLPRGQTQVAIGVVSGLFTGGSLMGMLVAGPIAEGLSWHWMFALPTFVIIATTAVLFGLMPKDPLSESDTRIDWAGVALLSTTLLALMLGIMLVTSGDLPPLATAGLILVVAALATGWVTVERRASSPMVDLRMLAAPAMWSACVLTLLLTVVSGMAVMLVPQLFSLTADGYGFGASTTNIGLLLVPGTIAGAMSGVLAGIAVRRFGPRPVTIAGGVVMTLTMIALTSLHDEAWQVAVARMLIAFSAGIGTTALLASTATTIAAKDTGIATSLLVVTRVVGVALGAQIAGAILDAGIDPVSGVPAESAFVTGFWVAAAAAAALLLVARLTKKGIQA